MSVKFPELPSLTPNMGELRDYLKGYPVIRGRKLRGRLLNVESYEFWSNKQKERHEALLEHIKNPPEILAGYAYRLKSCELCYGHIVPSGRERGPYYCSNCRAACVETIMGLRPKREIR